MDKDTRNKLRNVVTQCRRLLEDGIGEMLEGHFGIHATGFIEAIDQMGHLSPEDQTYREQVLISLHRLEAGGLGKENAVEQLRREVAYTHLNRFVAYKMMERRGLIREAVSRGRKSQGFLFYLADHPADERLWSGGQEDRAYRHFLEWLGASLSQEIGVLFSAQDPANRLFPSQRILDQVLELINDSELKDIWDGDETIGWVYQYFTPKELREQARAKSSVPRNSYELAFRNQFYTPSYVVQFLTDNTLGRLWYEMQQGDTSLSQQCTYLIRRPHEIFLSAGEGVPEQDEDSDMLYIAYRPKKDPRTLKILDPASGSAHFLLYCFTLLLVIYEEAYHDPELGPALQRDYPTLTDLRHAVPELILRHNLHGIDIDLRATQIAALALWLRAQRTYQELGIPREERPLIRKTNIVCAEPMPGDQGMLDEFFGGLPNYLPRRVLAQLVRGIFEKMKLASEAGSLLRIEQDLRDAITEAKLAWKVLPKLEQLRLFGDEPSQASLFDLYDVTDEAFWDQAEDLVLDALSTYSTQTAGSQGLARQLFADDAKQGFAFIDLCQQYYDVILMNPPFGKASKPAKSYIEGRFCRSKNDIYAAFVERGLSWLKDRGMLGAITSRTGFFQSSLGEWRQEILLKEVGIIAMADLGEDVLDEAMVETAAYCLEKGLTKRWVPFLRLLRYSDEVKLCMLNDAIRIVNQGEKHLTIYFNNPSRFPLLPDSPFVYWIPQHILQQLILHPPFEPNTGDVRQGLATSDDPRFVRALWEVKSENYLFCYFPSNGDLFCHLNDPIVIAFLHRKAYGTQKWAFHVKAGSSQPWFSPITVMVNWEDNAQELRQYIQLKGDSPSRRISGESYYFRPGFSWTLRSVRFIPYTIPGGCIPTASRYMAFPKVSQIFSALALTASNCASAFLRFYGEKFVWPKFLVENLKVLPCPNINSKLESRLEALVEQEVAQRRRAYQNHEPYQEFTAPPLLFPPQSKDNSLAYDASHLVPSDIEREIASAYGLSDNDLTTLELDLREALLTRRQSNDGQDLEEEESEQDSVIEVTPYSEREALISYAMGCVVGRWDIRISIDSSLASKLPGPFDPIPVCPPGALTDINGLPATSDKIVSEEWLRARPSAITLPPPGSVAKATIADSEYPLVIDWDGILVDDEKHQDDVVGRVLGTFELLWPQQNEIVIQETCKILGVSTLRDYFRRSGKGGFWMDHVGRYTKSHRKAPIYWLIQSKKRNYALWIYYHRLDKDIYYKALEKYVKLKLSLEDDTLKRVRVERTQFGTGGREAKQAERVVAQQEALISELRDFQEKLQRVAELQLEPDLDDGVLLNIAPLWELVPWNEAKKTWEELLAGQYAWSSISKQLHRRGVIR